jgi:hypothetical protein
LATRSEWPSISKHLVGEREELWWNFETERLGGIEVDRQLELGLLHDRHVRRLGAL